MAKSGRTNQHRTANLSVKVTPEEAAFIKQAAQDNGMGVSDFIREVMVGFSDE